ncbi:MAG: ribonuclease P protein component [Chitinophagaceae bacterium]|nr:ribonuclease P protein component [Chitinophagaceae bacterium]MBK9569457.1 ribonuclease P protein component [Chitinophagaceae bacterium]MBL0271555.1 ribonuclease P protein component [Chitinophagaceae bacterium]
MAKQFTLGKEERLKSRKQTEQLFSVGKKFTLAPFRVYYLQNSAENFLFKVGAGVSTKSFKKATDRNRIKRLIRETYRLQKSVLPERLKDQKMHLNFFIIYTGKELPDYKVVYDKMGKLLDKLCTLIQEIN